MILAMKYISHLGLILLGILFVQANSYAQSDGASADWKVKWKLDIPI